MAEPDNIVLEHLRAIRSKLEQHDARFDALDRRMDALDGRIEGLETRLDGLTHAVMTGFGAIVHRPADMKVRVGRLEAERV